MIDRPRRFLKAVQERIVQQIVNDEAKQSMKDRSTKQSSGSSGRQLFERSSSKQLMKDRSGAVNKIVSTEQMMIVQKSSQSRFSPAIRRNQEDNSAKQSTMLVHQNRADDDRSAI